MGFEATIPASERAKAVHALDRAATLTGQFFSLHRMNDERLHQLWGYEHSFGNGIKEELFNILYLST
jgi:hypothetical protein